MEAELEKQPTKEQTLEERFINRLRDLNEGDRGSMAILRRNAGLSIGESRGALGVFYRLLPMQLGVREEIYFLVATLYPLNTRAYPGENFGQSMATLRKVKDSESIERRMMILLDAEYDRGQMGVIRPGELGFRLRQAVRMLKSEDIGIDWVLLLNDLLRWSHPDKWVQKQWARSFFGKHVSEDK